MYRPITFRNLVLFLLLALQVQFLWASADSLRTAASAEPTDSLSVDATVLLARSYFGSDLDSAYTIGERARDRAQTIGLLGLTAEGENTMGIARLFQGNPAGALGHFQQVLAFRQEEGDTALVSGALNNVALAYQELGQTALALDHHIQSLRLKEALGDSTRIRVSYNNIGLIYEQLQDYSRARYYYRRAQAIFPLARDTAAYATNVYNIGVTFFKEGRSDSAAWCFDQSYPLVTAEGDQRMIGLHQMYYGVIEQEKFRLDTARQMILGALRIFEDLGKQDQIAAAKTYLGFNYLASGEPRSALRYCQAAWDIAQTTDNLGKQVDCLDCLHQSYRALGRSDAAYATAMQFFAYRDSLASVDIHKQIVRKDMEYDFTKQQLADSLQLARENDLVRLTYENELEQQQTLNFFMILVGVLLLGLVVLLFVNVRNNKRISSILEVRVQERTEELERQKDQLAEYAFINAHLLRQPLTQVLGLVSLMRMAKSEEELNHYIELLEASAAKLDQVIHEIRDVVEAEGNVPNLKNGLEV